MHKIIFQALPLLILCLALPTACNKKTKAVIPAESQAVDEIVEIYPDYRDITIPPNIAPLNIEVLSEGDQFVGSISGGNHQILSSAGKDGKLLFDSITWRSLLQANLDKDLTVTLYARRPSGWVKFPSYTIHVAPEPIDRYLSYRLIEPSYELYRQLGLYQRDLEGFTQTPIYENNRKFEDAENHCVNCHNYQNYSTDRMLFHIRAKHGGTLFIDHGKAVKMNMSTDSVLSSSVYPTWHPQNNWVVFSTNQTGQTFHMIDHQKIEVVDYGSDLIFYDADARSLTNILKTEDYLETFPCWSPDGKRLYYCSAYVPEFAGKDTDARRDTISSICKNIRYDLMSMPFDEATRTFGEPKVEFPCSQIEKSASVPRVSPDGRYVLFTIGDFGQFHIWHKTSDLYVKDLKENLIYPLEATNSDDVDSYHSWSSNGRWIVFSSRRDDGSYTRPYIAYFDKKGKGHKAFILPQEDPEQHILLTKSYNVPELTKNAVSLSDEEIRKYVNDDAAIQNVTYKSR